MTDYAKECLQQRKRQGKRLTLILLLLGMAITVLYFFCRTGDWILWLAPFNLACMAFSNWLNPAWIFVPLAVLALAGWMLLHLGRLFGREIIIGTMIAYLGCNLVFTPFYLLIVSQSMQISFLGRFAALSLSGTVYPVLVLVALHRWNPRRK